MKPEDKKPVKATGQTVRRIGRRSEQARLSPEKMASAAMESIESSEGDAVSALGISPEIAETNIRMQQTEAMVRAVAQSIQAHHPSRSSGGGTLETMARLRNDSLLGEISKSNGDKIDSKNAVSSMKSIESALTNLDNASVAELFQTETSRLDDYALFSQIVSLVTPAGEAVQAYVDNIISPDDHTKNDLQVVSDDPAVQNDPALQAEFDKQRKLVIEKYDLSERIETAIATAECKGDAFIAVLNLSQELNTVLNESEGQVSELLTEDAIPSADDRDIAALASVMGMNAVDLRAEILDTLNETAVLVENTDEIAVQYLKAVNESKKKRSQGGAPAIKGVAERIEIDTRGSIVKTYDPEHVIKLYSGDITFGYIAVDVSGIDVSEIEKRRASDSQSSLVNTMNTRLTTRILSGSTSLENERGKEALIGRVFIRALTKRIGKAEFLKKNDALALDVYEIVSRARRENKRLTFTFIAPDQMVHFTPDGSKGYGTSALSRVKFHSKLLIGAMTNAFMRNSVRRREQLVWFIECGLDNDAGNTIQNFIRTIKQREVKFSDLSDVTSTIRRIGEHHDFYVPMFNGERPVEVETINLGSNGEVDTPYLEYLRKAIVSGTGVPASYVGTSEDIQFARTLTAENGRFLRRIVRRQKHYGKPATKLFRLVWANEFQSLSELTGGAKQSDDAPNVKTGEDDGSGKDEHEKRAASIATETISVRFPCPSTLNLTNVADAINQAQPVADFIASTVAVGEDSAVVDEMKLLVIKDFMPQVNWGLYSTSTLETARRNVARRKVISKSSSGDAA